MFNMPQCGFLGGIQLGEPSKILFILSCFFVDNAIKLTADQVVAKN
jgi:hypothetical protein